MHKKKYLKGEQLYLISFFLLIMNQVLAQSQFNLMSFGGAILKAFRWTLILFFFFVIMYKGKYPQGKKGMFWMLFFIVTIIEMLLFDGRLLLLILSVVVIGSYRFNMVRIVRVHIVSLLTSIIFVVGCSLLGILDVQGVEKAFDNLTGFLFRLNNTRYTLGFTHCNILPIALVFVYLYVVLLKREKYKRYYDLIALAVNFGVYLLCGSRSCIVLIIVAIILRNICNAEPNLFLKMGTPLAICLLLCVLLFTIVLPISDAFNTPIVQKMDHLLTARLTLMRKIMTLYPFKLWGYGELNFDDSVEYIALDNGYITLFVTRGIIIGFIFMTILIALLLRAKKKNNPYELLFLIILILGNLIDNSLLHYVTFPMYIMAFNDFIGDAKKNAFAKINWRHRLATKGRLYI